LISRLSGPLGYRYLGKVASCEVTAEVVHVRGVYVLSVPQPAIVGAMPAVMTIRAMSPSDVQAG
jgi:hypothetical protein